MTEEIMEYIRQAARDGTATTAWCADPQVREEGRVDSKHLYDVFKKGPMKRICKWARCPTDRLPSEPPTRGGRVRKIVTANSDFLDRQPHAGVAS